MNNSTVEQLKRDAGKKGAYQAKIAYVQLLINANYLGLHEKNITNLLQQIDEKAPDVFQNAAAYFRGLLLELTHKDKNEIISAYEKVSPGTKYYSLACAKLCELYKGLDVLNHEFYKQELAKSPIQKTITVRDTEDQSAEFQYKTLRFQFDRGVVAGYENYADSMYRLLNHPELTDTLEAKIRFQIIRAKLLQASENGVKPVGLINQIKNEFIEFTKPKLAPMAKAQKVELLKQKLETACSALLSSYNLAALAKDQNLSCAIKTMLENDEVKALFKRQHPREGILDSYSNLSMRIYDRHFEISRAAGALAYARALTSGSMFEIKVMTSLNGQDRVRLMVSEHTTASEVIAAVFKHESQSPVPASLLFKSLGIADSKTLKEAGVGENDYVTRALGK